MAEYIIIFDTATGLMTGKQISSAHLADGAVVSGKLGAGSVISGYIASGQVGTPHIADNAITGTHVTSGAVFQGIIISGRLGLGVSVPTEKLDIADFPLTRVRVKTLSGATATIEFDVRDDPPFALAATVGSLYVIDNAGAGANPFRIYHYTPSNLLILTSAGRIGLSTLTPSEQLHVTSGIAVGGQVDGVDISAHVHTGGAGDAGLVLSAGIGSGVLGPHLASGGILSAHISSGLIGWPFTRAQGVLSSALALQAVGLPHFVRGATSSQVLTAQGAGADLIYADVDYPKKLKPALTRWVMPGWFVYSISGYIMGAGRIYYTPIFVAETTTYIRIGVWVTTLEAGTADLRIFAWNNGVPGALILSAGTVDTGSTGAKELVISQQLTRGYYFLAIRCTASPFLYGSDGSGAITSPVPGMEGDPRPPAYPILTVLAAFADPAPAPTGFTTVSYATVSLREN